VNHYPTGDILDLHNYPEPQMYLYDAQRINVLGEYGGIGLALETIFGLRTGTGVCKIQQFKEVTDEYIKYAEMLKNDFTWFLCCYLYPNHRCGSKVNGL